MINSPATLIVGYPGRLATAFSRQWPLARRIGRANCDITDRRATLQAINDLQPRLVVNCAAITDMTRCEAEPDLAWAVNVRGVRNLAEACKHVGARLAHFSSDYALDPVNEYAWTKRASEALADLTVRAKIYDVSHWAWVSLREGQSVRMLTTEHLNPISVYGLALMVEELFCHGLQGLIAAGSRDRLSFYQVARIWATVLGADPGLIEPVERLESASPRLAEMFLDIGPLLTAGVHVPTLAEDAHRYKEWLAISVADDVAPGPSPRKALVE